MDKPTNQPQGSSRLCPLASSTPSLLIWTLGGCTLVFSSTFPAEPPPQPCTGLSHVVSQARLGRRQAGQDRSGHPYPGYNCECKTVVIDPVIHTWLCGCGMGFQELPLWIVEVVALMKLHGGARWDGDGQEGLKGQVGEHLGALIQHRPSRGGSRSPEAGRKASCWGGGESRVQICSPMPQPWPEAP